MKCPIDQTELAMSDRQGIEIDYCPQCRGVWLDRGELDKIIEKSAAPAPIQPEPRNYDRPQNTHYTDGYEKSHKKRRKESFLGDLFDF